MKKAILFSVLLIFGFSFIKAQGYQRIESLYGRWKFSIGDNKEWSQANFNDSQWESIRVPSAWENNGFDGYDGFAWYRRSVFIDKPLRNASLYIHLGYIDDVDEVYVNGNLIGYSGSMPPDFSTAYNAFRRYYIPSEYINYGKANLVSVKVYDAGLGGGIVDGDVGLYADYNAIPFDFELQGQWKFMQGDNISYSKLEYNDFNWNNITVPRAWEDQGYRDYDGFAWYRKKFYVTGNYDNERMIVILGKIDDFDEVYLNGEYIGPTRRIAERNGTNYDQMRAYYISGKLLKQGKANVIAVRVLDKGGMGGIYEGPIGIVKQKSFVEYWRNKR